MLRLYKRFSRNGQNFKLIKQKHIIYHFEERDLRILNISSVSRTIQISRFTKAFSNFAKFIIAFIFAKF